MRNCDFFFANVVEKHTARGFDRPPFWVPRLCYDWSLSRGMVSCCAAGAAGAGPGSCPFCMWIARRAAARGHALSIARSLCQAAVRAVPILSGFLGLIRRGVRAEGADVGGRRWQRD